MSKTWAREMLAAVIDHTLLKAAATPNQIVSICLEAMQYHFAAVCVNPFHVPLVARELSGSKVKTCSVIGFPLGANASAAKAEEAARAVRQGAGSIW